MEQREVHRGEVFYADLSPVVGSEQGGVRPVLIVQNDVGNRFSPTVIAAAITSKQDKSHLPTHIGLKAGTGGLTRDSVVLLEQIRTLDKRRLRERAGKLTQNELCAECELWLRRTAVIIQHKRPRIFPRAFVHKKTKSKSGFRPKRVSLHERVQEIRQKPFERLAIANL